MYEKELAVKQPQKEHLEFADKVAEEITGKFAPEQQNEAVKKIKSVIAEIRKERIERAIAEAEFLKNSLNDLLG